MLTFGSESYVFRIKFYDWNRPSTHPVYLSFLEIKKWHKRSTCSLFACVRVCEWVRLSVRLCVSVRCSSFQLLNQLGDIIRSDKKFMLLVLVVTTESFLLTDLLTNSALLEELSIVQPLKNPPSIHYRVLVSDFIQLVITKWRTRVLVRRESYYHYLV
jgi:hypothetical protein